MHSSIKVDEDIQKRVEFITDGTETMSQFIKKATIERLNRMEARDDRKKKQLNEKLLRELRPLVIKIVNDAQVNGLIHP